MLLEMFAKAQAWFLNLQTRAREERGASAVEYGLLVALIAAVIVLVVSVVGNKVSSAFNSVNSALPP
jgi:pilus assembly protein Flp/PilA